MNAPVPCSSQRHMLEEDAARIDSRPDADIARKLNSIELPKIVGEKPPRHTESG